MKYLYIDNIRGIAILMVILVHSAQRIDGISSVLSIISRYGQMGVQLFFIASAYTLCLSHEKRKHEKNPVTNFYIRRFWRIAPLYYLGIILYFLLAVSKAYFVTSTFTTQYSISNVLANVFFVHGFYPPANNNIVPGGWSIGTEMVFYALFPFIYFVAYKWIALDKKAIWMLPIAGIIFSQFFNTFLFIYFDRSIANNNFIYFNIFNQIPIFLFGISLFFLRYRGSNIINGSALVLLTVASIVLWRMKVNYLFSIIPVISGLSLSFLFLLLKNNRWLCSRVIGDIGKNSYGMYLSHFLFAWYLPQLVTYPLLRETFHPDIIFLFSFVLVVILSYVVAKILHRFIESPAISFARTVIASREMANK